MIGIFSLINSEKAGRSLPAGQEEVGQLLEPADLLLYPNRDEGRQGSGVGRNNNNDNHDNRN